MAAALIVIIDKPPSVSDPLGAAIAQLSASKAGASLIQERQEVILEDAATQSFSVKGKPKISSAPPSGGAPIEFVPPNPASAQGIAFNMLPSFGFANSGTNSQWTCLLDLWNRESGWRYNATNATSGAYGIPQALPGSKMATSGADWMTNPATQINWGLGYIKNRYGNPCGAWAMEEAQGFY